MLDPSFEIERPIPSRESFGRGWRRKRRRSKTYRWIL